MRNSKLPRIAAQPMPETASAVITLDKLNYHLVSIPLCCLSCPINHRRLCARLWGQLRQYSTHASMACVNYLEQ